MCFGKTIDQFGIEEARKVAVESFVVTDEFVAEAEGRHESSFLELEYGTDRAQEEDAFNGSECNYSFGKLVLVGLHHLRAQLALH
jgi:hypothetical protein